MKRGILILGLLIALSMFLANPVAALRENVYLTRLSFFDEYALPGDYLPLLIELNDEVKGWLKDVTVTVMVPDLNIRQTKMYHRLRGEETDILFLWIPYDTPKGEYITRISVYSDDDNEIRRIKHRFFYVW